MNLRAKALITAGVVLLSGMSLGTVALATPPSNPPPAATNLVIGTIDGRTQIKQDHIELKTKSSTKVASFTLTYPPGSYSGWHSHPGIVVAIVKSGTVLRQVGCRRETFTAGEAFTEVGTHRVSNPGTVDAVLEITQIYPKLYSDNTETRRFEESDPCPWRPTP